MSASRFLSKPAPYTKRLACTSLLALSASLQLGSLQLASAQTNQEDTAARLETVEVTAQRITQDAQDVPISITTLSGDKLDNLKAGGADIRFLSARVPSVVAESSFGRTFPRFYIRGIGNTDFDLNSTQPVSLVYDDVPYENPILKGYPVFDIAQVEVLRGPQGSLFGRNTPGGIIKFDSVKPGGETNGYGRVSYGRFDSVDVEGAFGATLTDGLSFRASGLYQRRDDYVDNAFTGENNALEGFEEYAGRIQLLAEPTDNTSFLINLHGRSADGSSRVFRANIIDQGERGLGANFDRDTVSQDGLNDQTLDAYGLTARAEWGVTEAISLTYIFGFETADIQSRGDVVAQRPALFLSRLKARAMLMILISLRTSFASLMTMAAPCAVRPVSSCLTRACRLPLKVLTRSRRAIRKMASRCARKIPILWASSLHLPMMSQTS